MDQAAVVVVRLDPDGPLRGRLQRPGEFRDLTTDPPGAPRDASPHGGPRAGDRNPDQAVAAAGDVVGVAGQSLDQESVTAGHPMTGDGACRRLGYRHERLVS